MRSKAPFGLLVALLACVWPVMASADPNPSSWENWKTDFDLVSVPLVEIQTGGPPKDGIPSIDQPKFETLTNHRQTPDNAPVIGLEINGDARAYPLSVLMWHEIANDVVGGKPVAVTYCPLCNAAIVFDATLEGVHLDFGTTGRLRKSDLLMYDRQTESWWQQFTGEAIIGEMLGSRLKILPSRLESYASFKNRFPGGKVLVPNNPGLRRYGDNPYVGYDTLSRPMLYHGEMPNGIEPMARVVVIRQKNATPLVISLAKLRNDGKANIASYSLSWQKGQASALDSRNISKGRDIGNVVVHDVRTGLEMPYDLTFAFVAHAFHPEAEIIQ